MRASYLLFVLVRTATPMAWVLISLARVSNADMSGLAFYGSITTGHNVRASQNTSRKPRALGCRTTVDINIVYAVVSACWYGRKWLW